MLNQNEQKILVANTAIDTLITEKKIFSGMKIGLGTGSTALPAVKRLAERIADGTLKHIEAVPTSFQTANYCQDLDIPVYSLNHRSIDGADAIDPQNNLIKGGGAALLREKIVAYNSTNYAIVADGSKIVPNLGTKFPLPVEIIAEARASVITALEKLGATCTLREGVRKCGPVITDCGNQILDCVWQIPVDPAKMEDAINGIPGVVETGFFTKHRPIVFYSTQDGNVEIRR